MPAGLEALMARLGYRFQNEDLLRRAMTHKSRTAESSSGSAVDYERLEFLGDSVLGFLVSEELIHRYPDLDEGSLSKLKALLVSSQHLYAVANELRFGEALLLGRGEELSGGRTKKAILSDALEAVIAALYLDGGMEVARRFVLDHVVGEFRPPGVLSFLPGSDFKSALQEAVQALKLPLPRYLVVRERGPEHSKTFTVEVRVGKDYVTQADGVSKKDAGQRAAQAMLQQLLAGAGSGTPTEELSAHPERR